MAQRKFNYSHKDKGVSQITKEPIYKNFAKPHRGQVIILSCTIHSKVLLVDIMLSSSTINSNKDTHMTKQLVLSKWVIEDLMGFKDKLYTLVPIATGYCVAFYLKCAFYKHFSQKQTKKSGWIPYNNKGHTHNKLTCCSYLLLAL